MRVCDPYEKQMSSHERKSEIWRQTTRFDMFLRPRRSQRNREQTDTSHSCSRSCPFFPAHTHTLHPLNTMSAFLAGSPVVAKVAAKPVAKRNVTVRAAAPSEYVPRLPSRSFILLARTLSHAAEPRNVATRRRASWLTFDAPPRPIPPRVVNNSSVTRRAAVAGVLAFFVAQPVRPDRVSSDIRFPRPPSRRVRVSSAAATHRSPPPLCRPRPHRAGLRRDQARAREGCGRAVQPLRRVHVQVRGLGVRQVQGPPRVPQGRASGGHEGVRPRAPSRPVNGRRATFFGMHTMRKRFFSSRSERASERASVL